MPATLLPPGVHAFGVTRQSLNPGPQTFIYSTPVDANFLFRMMRFNHAETTERIRFGIERVGVETYTPKKTSIPTFTTPAGDGRPRIVDAANLFNRILAPNTRLALTVYHDALDWFSVSFIGVLGWRAT